MAATPLERGLVFYQLGQYARAEKEFFAALRDDPNNSLAYSMLAMSGLNTKKRKEALEFAKKSVEFEPDFPYGHYALAVCYADLRKPWLAMPAIVEALRLDPGASDYWGFKAYLHLNAASKLRPNEAKNALECSETGLQCDPYDVRCGQLRIRALLLLNRKAEAMSALKQALQIDPINAESHELRAWLALEGGKSEEARDFYKEALRLDPNSSSARTGLLSALRARHKIYRFFLNFMNADGSVKMLPLIVIGGAPFAVAYLHKISNPMCQALSLALIVPVCCFTILTLFSFFLANPIFNLVLWLDPQTRWSLSADEVLAAKLLAANLLTVAVITCLAIFNSILWYLPLAMFGLLIAPVVIVFEFSPGKVRKFLFAFVAVNFLCAFSATVLLFSLDYLEANFKGQMDNIGAVWATTMSVSIGLSILSFHFSALSTRVQNVLDRYGLSKGD